MRSQIELKVVILLHRVAFQESSFDLVSCQVGVLGLSASLVRTDKIFLEILGHVAVDRLKDVSAVRCE